MTRPRIVNADVCAVHGVLNRIDRLGLELLDAHQADDHPASGEDISPSSSLRSPWTRPATRAANDIEESGGIATAIGPVEYIIVGFPGNQFNGEIAPSSASSSTTGPSESDLVFITKDADGHVGAFDFEEHHDVALFNSLDGEVGGFISDEDIEYAATQLEPNSSAALLIWETCGPLHSSKRNSGGVLIEGSRIPPRPDRSRRGRMTPTTARRGEPSCCAVDPSPEPPSRRQSWSAAPTEPQAASIVAKTDATCERLHRERSEEMPVLGYDYPLLGVFWTMMIWVLRIAYVQDVARTGDGTADELTKLAD